MLIVFLIVRKWQDVGCSERNCAFCQFPSGLFCYTYIQSHVFYITLSFLETEKTKFQNFQMPKNICFFLWFRTVLDSFHPAVCQLDSALFRTALNVDSALSQTAFILAQRCPRPCSTWPPQSSLKYFYFMNLLLKQYITKKTIYNIFISSCTSSKNVLCFEDITVGVDFENSVQSRTAVSLTRSCPKKSNIPGRHCICK